MKLGIKHRNVMDRLWAALPENWQVRLTPLARRLDMLFVDHGFLRAMYLNFHAVDEAGQMFRGAQPAPEHIERMAKRGIKTIINLRGARRCGSYELEEEACRKYGVTLVNFPVSSRDTPKVEWLTGARDMFGEIEYPAYMHCKSGADRAGLMSTLYLFVHEKKPLEEAMKQLSLRYGHIKQAKTGLIDWFFENYDARAKESPIDFYEWIDTEYDRQEMKDRFMARGWATVLVDFILRRE